MDENLKNIIVNNQNLIYKIASYFTYYNNKEDLFQAGCIGLITAYKKYSSTQGAKFTTYAYPFILGEMKKCIRNDKGIKISRDINKLSISIDKANTLLTQKLMREPTTKELSQFLNIDEYLVIEALKVPKVIHSMEEIIIEDNKGLTLLDTIQSEKTLDINTLIALKEELKKLSTQELQIIEKRYMNDMTQSETAQIIGMSQVQVSRQEQKVLKKLRESLVS